MRATFVLRLSIGFCVLFLLASAAAEFHVSPSGDDRNPGTLAKPFRTIGAGARAAQPGDFVTVHAGVYRERVTPPRGGAATRPITYQAAPGEEVVIKGSEPVRGWTRHAGQVWKVTLPDSFFGAYNPYRDRISGDWFTDRGRPHHTGEVYLNGTPLWEAASLEGVLRPQPFQPARKPEGALLAWFVETGPQAVTLYANFQGRDPNAELVEINVRDSCFYPDQPGRDYITVRGFRMMHAATQWAAPTAEQIALLGTHFSKGWVIESNTISDSRCSCITLGKERATGHNVWINEPSKDGATHYNEVVQRALKIGWSKETVGSHVVRNNTVFRCEQAGIAGSLGAIHSRITGNHIYDVWERRQFTGAEMGGIKLHAAIDVLIEGNRIHNAGRGLWMDWMAQGTRITRNLLYDNTTDDLFVEVNHGPFLVDNNLFLSPLSLKDWSEGGAYAHNLFLGQIESRPEPGRKTPYHPAHSTRVTDIVTTRGGDNRFYNNLFGGGAAKDQTEAKITVGYGLWVYDHRPLESFAAGNVFFGGARPAAMEREATRMEGERRYVVRDEGAHVHLELPAGLPPRPAATRPVTTELLGRTRVAGLAYEDVDGRPVRIDKDYLGRPRSAKPSAGPFEEATGRVKVW
jgi:hypothetical protein